MLSFGAQWESSALLFMTLREVHSVQRGPRGSHTQTHSGRTSSEWWEGLSGGMVTSATVQNFTANQMMTEPRTERESVDAQQRAAATLGGKQKTERFHTRARKRQTVTL